MRRPFIDEKIFRFIESAVSLASRDIEIISNLAADSEKGAALGLIYLPNPSNFDELSSNKRKHDVFLKLRPNLALLFLQGVEKKDAERAMDRLIRSVSPGTPLDIFGSYTYIPRDKLSDPKTMKRAFFLSIDLLIILFKTGKKGRMRQVLGEVI